MPVRYIIILFQVRGEMEPYYVLLALVVLALGTGLLRRGFRPTSVDLSAITVEVADGTPVRLGGLIDRATVLVMVRYYG